MTGQEILELIQKDVWMMKVIQTASSLKLPDWIIGAGFVRNKVRNHLSGREMKIVDTRDIDLVYFDPNGNDEKKDQELSERLKQETGMKWEVVNQFYTHTWKKSPPYTSTEDAISCWPETATAVGVTLDENNKLRLIAPYGTDDLVNFVVRQSPKFKGEIEKVKERVVKKKWLEKWPKITFVK